MNYQDEIKSYPSEEVAKEMPRHLDFTNNVFNELKGFDVEQQVEILHCLYKRLEDVYQCEIEVNLKTAEDFKQRLQILKKIEPKA